MAKTRRTTKTKAVRCISIILQGLILPLTVELIVLWAQTRTLKNEVQELKTTIINIDQQINTTNQQVDTIDQRVITVNQQVETIDQRVSTVNQQIDSIEVRVNSIQNQIRGDGNTTVSTITHN